MTIVKAGIMLLIGLVSPAWAASPSHFVSNKPCTFEFDYPADWQVTPLPPDKMTHCAVQIRPKDFAARMAKYDVDLHTVYVSVPGGGTFLNAASSSGFDFYRGHWATTGRQNIHGEATVVNGDRWSGVKGTATVGCHHEHGGYAGLCEFERAVLEDKDENIWTIEGGPQTSATFEMVLATFKFRAE
jgi:hypothetical protein